MIAAMVMMMATTTVPVKRETLRRLPSYKIDGTTSDELLN